MAAGLKVMASGQGATGTPKNVTGTMSTNGVKTALDVVQMSMDGSPLEAIDIVKQGKAFIASSGKLNLTLAGHAKVVFENPVSSMFDLVIDSFIIAHNATLTFGKIILNPTSGLPTTPKFLKNLLFTLANDNNVPESGATIKADTNSTPLGGGIEIDEFAALGGVRDTIRQMPIVVKPGVKIGINIAFVGAAVGDVTLYFHEIPTTN